MQQERESATLSEYWAIVRRRWRVVLVCVLVATLLAGLWLVRSGSSYTSDASVVIRPITAQSFAGTRIEDVGADTEATVVDSTVVARRAASKLGGDLNAQELVRKVTADNPTGTLILNISFTAGSPARARAGAQAFADAYLEYRRATAEQTKTRQLAQIDQQLQDLNQELGETLTTIGNTAPGSDARSTAEARRAVLLTRIGEAESTRGTVDAIDTQPGQVIRPANLPSAPSGPPTVLTLLGAGALGALVGVALALVRDRTDRRIRSHRDLVELVGQEPIGEIPRSPQPSAPTLVAAREPAGAEAAAYRRLRVHVWPRRGVGPRRILVTSPSPGLAADAVGANLAVTVAASGGTALLAWPHKPDVDPFFDVVPLPTVEVFGGELPVEKLLVEVPDVHGLTLLPTLSVQPDGAAWMDATQVAARLAELEAVFDTEIIVGAPLLSSAESIELCPLVDATIVAFDPSVSDRSDLERAIDVLSGVGTEVLGIVAFRVPTSW